MVIEELMETYGEKLYNLAARITGNREEAHDIVQDTFLTALEKSNQFRGESTHYTWLYRIAVNRSLQYKRVPPPEVLEAQINALDYSDTSLPDAIKDWENNPEKELHLKQLTAEVKAECHHFLLFILTPEQRITFLLRTIIHLSYKEIGEILDIEENAVKARMDRIKKRIVTDFSKRCSIHNKDGICKCKATLKYVLHSFPQILNNISGNTEFISEIEDAFRNADKIELLYEKLPYLSYNSDQFGQLFPNEGEQH